MFPFRVRFAVFLKIFCAFESTKGDERSSKVLNKAFFYLVCRIIFVNYIKINLFLLKGWGFGVLGFWGFGVLGYEIDLFQKTGNSVAPKRIP